MEEPEDVVINVPVVWHKVKVTLKWIGRLRPENLTDPDQSTAAHAASEGE